MKFFDIGAEANGFIAVGQFATGVIAFGQVATGVIAIGQLATGLVAVGQLARGGVVLGQLGIGVGSVGMVAVGGAGAAGLVSVGPIARGPVPLALLPKFRAPPTRPLSSMVAIERGELRNGWVSAHVRRQGDALQITEDVTGHTVHANASLAPTLLTRAGARVLLLVSREEITREPEGAGYREPVRVEQQIVASSFEDPPRPPARTASFWAGAALRAVAMAGVAVLTYFVALVPVVDHLQQLLDGSLNR